MSVVPPPLLKYRQLIYQFLSEYLIGQSVVFGSQTWARDVFSRLGDFAVTGKLLRGCLVLIAYDGLVRTKKKNVQFKTALQAAAAMELFQSGVLIHDDIIDQDELRRGQPAMHIQYQTLATAKSWKAPALTGENI